MSGGAYDYLYEKLDIIINNDKEDLRRYKFQKLLGYVADALYAIEWVDSGDYTPGDEYEAIDNVFKFLGEN